MYTFNIPDISCGHCAKAITSAINELDPNASIEVDIAEKRVHIDSRKSREELLAALSEADYPAES